ncbi:IPT/TIG domain-containing protein [Flavobacterium agrisoli]|uniref:IPT/TIG domain-containing protein n=1 Tax=Flavobacterium agrisoli TaxID=2793066 RepID=A0A934PPT7_9FLAO|nr:IPT/TIG domain-containing protein [Flavobacterium agrisoli]MBK0371125.1 IPT/TIG domain-containing protein [Flavobacterium agrisoli]
MRKFLKKLELVFWVISICAMIQCNGAEEDIYLPPTVIDYQKTGLLGQELTLDIQDVEFGKLQVFFDLEEAPIKYVSDEEIKVTVPRTLKRSNPILKVIDLNENKTILSENFFLDKPLVTKYSHEEVSFDEVFTIYGENFDINKDFLSVLVNDEKATIISSDYNKIEVKIPTKITNATLEIKVNAQLQQSISPISLQLKKPIIKGFDNDALWLGAVYNIEATNFNPDPNYGELFINGIPSPFSVYNNKLQIAVPPGPYNDFKITNITYKTAGLIDSYDCNLPILSDFILVDQIEDSAIEHSIFTHKGNAYALQYESKNNGFFFNRNYSFISFSPSTEKWTQLQGFTFTGYITNAVYDGVDTVYLYKFDQQNQTYSLSCVNMNTLKETNLTLPSNKIAAPILFAYQDDLYLLSGLNTRQTDVSVREQKYKYSKTDKVWTVLPSTAFSALPLASIDSAGGNSCSYTFSGGNIYISYGINFKTYKIDSNLNITVYPFEKYFEYKNTIIGRSQNSYNFLYNYTTLKGIAVNIDSLFGYSSNCFTLNNNVYYIRNSWSSYYQNSTYTQKLKKEFLDGLL